MVSIHHKTAFTQYSSLSFIAQIHALLHVFPNVFSYRYRYITVNKVVVGYSCLVKFMTNKHLHIKLFVF